MNTMTAATQSAALRIRPYVLTMGGPNAYGAVSRHAFKSTQRGTIRHVADMIRDFAGTLGISTLAVDWDLTEVAA